jgi:WD40 repeat protein
VLAWVATECVLPITFLLSFLQGHVEELWGLATHPSRAQFVTCGQDKLVHLWSSETHQPVWSRSIEVWAAMQVQASEKWLHFTPQASAQQVEAARALVGLERALTALPEVLSSNPRNHMVANNPL